MDDPRYLGHGLQGGPHEVVQGQRIHQPGPVMGGHLHEREYAVMHAREAALDVHGQHPCRMPQGQRLLQLFWRVHVGRGEVEVIKHHLTSVPQMPFHYSVQS